MVLADLMARRWVAWLDGNAKGPSVMAEALRFGVMVMVAIGWAIKLGLTDVVPEETKRLVKAGC